ncbi:MAG: hypothetical protein KTR30_11415 [Saprospiraceae bacterium]|nr:hypothetical protein [Saprospiraceae bacterium]
MNLKRISLYVVLLVAGLGLGYAVGTANPRNVPIKKASTETISLTQVDTLRDTSAVSPTDTGSLVVDESSANPGQPDIPNDQDILIADTGNAVSGLPSADLCFKPGSDELRNTLLAYTQKLEGDSLWYNRDEPKKLLDCSGIFHRVSKFISDKCDAYAYPDVDSTRHTSALAGWYYDNKNLVIIQDAAKQRNLIKPGTVMFFGKSGQLYNNLTIDRLKTPYPNNVIMHVGVVTDVTKNDNGELVKYTMFHGRSKGKIASSTYYHSLDPPRAGFPPLGNWDQQLVAVANIMTPK